MRRHFHSLHIHGLTHLQNLSTQRPILAYVNHHSWWDGILLIYLSQHYFPQYCPYCLMEEKQLRAYRFFSWLGAYSIDLHSPKKAAVSLRYTLKLLHSAESPPPLIWIFPEGRLVPPNAHYEPRVGFSWLLQQCAKKATPQILPVAFRYFHLREELPEAFVAIGRHLDNPSLQASTEGLEHLLKTIDGAVRRENYAESFVKALPPRLSINQRWDRFREYFRSRKKDGDRS